jgi:hypothetical protein
MRWLVVLCLVAGCANRYRVTVDGPILHQHAADLRKVSFATVEADESRTQESDTVSQKIAEPITIDQTVHDRKGKVRWVRDLLRGCDDRDFTIAKNPDCELVATDSFYEIRRYQTRSTTRFLQFTLAGAIGGVFVGALVCTDACPEDSKIDKASEITVGVTVAALVGVLVWGVVDCMGHWGEPGCRD